MQPNPFEEIDPVKPSPAGVNPFDEIAAQDAAIKNPFDEIAAADQGAAFIPPDANVGAASESGTPYVGLPSRSAGRATSGPRVVGWWDAIKDSAYRGYHGESQQDLAREIGDLVQEYNIVSKMPPGSATTYPSPIPPQMSGATMGIGYGFSNTPPAPIVVTREEQLASLDQRMQIKSEELRSISQNLARSQGTTQGMQNLNNANGLAESLSAIVSNPIDIGGQLFAESAWPSAKVLGTGLAAAGATALTGGSAPLVATIGTAASRLTQGVTTAVDGSDSELFSRLYEMGKAEGVDITQDPLKWIQLAKNNPDEFNRLFEQHKQAANQVGMAEGAVVAAAPYGIGALLPTPVKKGIAGGALRLGREIADETIEEVVTLGATDAARGKLSSAKDYLTTAYGGGFSGGAMHLGGEAVGATGTPLWNAVVGRPDLPGDVAAALEELAAIQREQEAQDAADAQAQAQAAAQPQPEAQPVPGPVVPAGTGINDQELGVAGETVDTAQPIPSPSPIVQQTEETQAEQPSPVQPQDTQQPQSAAQQTPEAPVTPATPETQSAQPAPLSREAQVYVANGLPADFVPPSISDNETGTKKLERDLEARRQQLNNALRSGALPTEQLNAIRRSIKDLEGAIKRRTSEVALYNKLTNNGSRRLTMPKPTQPAATAPQTQAAAPAPQVAPSPQAASPQPAAPQAEGAAPALDIPEGESLDAYTNDDIATLDNLIPRFEEMASVANTPKGKAEAERRVRQWKNLRQAIADRATQEAGANQEAGVTSEQDVSEQDVERILSEAGDAEMDADVESGGPVDEQDLEDRRSKPGVVAKGGIAPEREAEAMDIAAKLFAGEDVGGADPDLVAKIKSLIEEGRARSANGVKGAERQDLTKWEIANKLSTANADRASGVLDLNTVDGKIIMAAAMAHEVQQHSSEGKTDVNADWYSASVERTIRIANELLGGALDDPGNDAIFRLIFAITSNGQKVWKNAEIGTDLMKKFLATGRFSNDFKGGGARQAQMVGHLALADKLLTALGGDRQLFARFLNTKFTPDEIFAELSNLGFASTPESKRKWWNWKLSMAREIGDVYGSYIFGPKLGGEFYQNMRGNKSQTTKDTWFTRGFYRIKGDLTEVGTKAIGKAIERLIAGSQAEGYKVPRAVMAEAKRTLAAIKSGKVDTRTPIDPNGPLWAFAKQRLAEYAKSKDANGKGFADKTEVNLASKSIVENARSVQETVRPGDRSIMDDVSAMARAMLSKSGMELTPDAFQAEWWGSEKALYDHLGQSGALNENETFDLAMEKVYRDTTGNEYQDPEDYKGSGPRRASARDAGSADAVDGQSVQEEDSAGGRGDGQEDAGGPQDARSKPGLNGTPKEIAELQAKAAELDRRRQARAEAQDRNTDPATRRRGPEAVVQRLVNELRRGGKLTVPQVMAMLRPIEKLIEHGYLDDLAVVPSGSTKLEGTRGAYSPVASLIMLFLPNIADTGDGTFVRRTFAHEVAHHLERMLPERFIQALRQDLKRARAKWLKNKPGFEKLLGAGNWIEFSMPMSEVQARLKSGELVGNDPAAQARFLKQLNEYFGWDTKKGNIRLAWTDESYRLANTSEWLAENIAEIAADRDEGRVNSQGKIGIWRSITDVLVGMYEAIRKAFGKDVVEDIWDRFQAGEMPTEFQRESMDMAGSEASMERTASGLFDESDPENYFKRKRDVAQQTAQKPIKFWTDIGHEEDKDKTKQYLWAMERDGTIQIVSVAELEERISDNGGEVGEKNVYGEYMGATHLDWADVTSDQWLLAGPAHGRIDDTGDVTRVSMLGRIKDDKLFREQVKERIAAELGKQAKDIRGYDFTDVGYNEDANVFDKRTKAGLGMDEPNHGDANLARRGFLTNKAADTLPEEWRAGARLRGGFNDFGDIAFTLDDPDRNSVAGIKVTIEDGEATVDRIDVDPSVRGMKLSNVLYAEVGERLRRKGITKLNGKVIDQEQRPIKARQSTFGKDSTEITAEDRFKAEQTGEDPEIHRWVRTHIDPKQLLDQRTEAGLGLIPGTLERPSMTSRIGVPSKILDLNEPGSFIMDGDGFIYFRLPGGMIRATRMYNPYMEHLKLQGYDFATGKYRPVSIKENMEAIGEQFVDIRLNDGNTSAILEIKEPGDEKRYDEKSDIIAAFRLLRDAGVKQVKVRLSGPRSTFNLIESVRDTNTQIEYQFSSFRDIREEIGASAMAWDVTLLMKMAEDPKVGLNTSEAMDRVRFKPAGLESNPGENYFPGRKTDVSTTQVRRSGENYFSRLRLKEGQRIGSDGRLVRAREDRPSYGDIGHDHAEWTHPIFGDSFGVPANLYKYSPSGKLRISDEMWDTHATELPGPFSRMGRVEHAIYHPETGKLLRRGRISMHVQDGDTLAERMPNMDHVRQLKEDMADLGRATWKAVDKHLRDVGASSADMASRVQGYDTYRAHNGDAKAADYDVYYYGFKKQDKPAFGLSVDDTGPMVYDQRTKPGLRAEPVVTKDEKGEDAYPVDRMRDSTLGGNGRGGYPPVMGDNVDPEQPITRKVNTLETGSPERARQIKEWIKDSAIKRQVFRGQPEAYETFDPDASTEKGQDGFMHLTFNHDYATDYADEFGANSSSEKTSPVAVVGGYLNVKNVIDLGDLSPYVSWNNWQTYANRIYKAVIGFNPEYSEKAKADLWRDLEREFRGLLEGLDPEYEVSVAGGDRGSFGFHEYLRHEIWEDLFDSASVDAIIYKDTGNNYTPWSNIGVDRRRTGVTAIVIGDPSKFKSSFGSNDVNPDTDNMFQDRRSKAGLGLKADPVLVKNEAGQDAYPVDTKRLSLKGGDGNGNLAPVTSDDIDPEDLTYRRTNVLRRGSKDRVAQIKEWVKDSAIKEPMFRGNSRPYETYSTDTSLEKGGDGLMHMTFNPDYAYDYTYGNADYRGKQGTSAAVVQGYVNVKNVIDLDDLGPSLNENNFQQFASRILDAVKKFNPEISREKLIQYKIDLLEQLENLVDSRGDFYSLDEGAAFHQFLRSDAADELFRRLNVDGVIYRDTGVNHTPLGDMGTELNKKKGVKSLAISDPKLFKATFGGNDVNPETDNMFQDQRTEGGLGLEELISAAKQASGEKDSLAAMDAWAGRLLADARGRLNIPGPDVLAALVWDTSRSIAKGGITFAKWSAQQIKDFGPQFKPRLKALWATARRIAGNMTLFPPYRYFMGVSSKAWDNVSRFPQSKTLRQLAETIANRLGPDATAEETDIPSRIKLAHAQFENIWSKILERFAVEFSRMNKAERRAWDMEFRSHVINGTVPSDPKLAKAVDDYRRLMKALRDYQVAAGIEIGDQGEYYFPRRYDSAAVEGDPNGFVEDAMQAYKARDVRMGNPIKSEEEYRAMAEAWRDNILTGKIDDMSLFGKSGSKSSADSTETRSFDNDEAAILERFIVEDVDQITLGYIQASVRYAEAARTFGADGAVFTKMMSKLAGEGVDARTISEMERLVKKSIGIGRERLSDAGSYFMDWMSLVIAAAYLGKSAMYNMILEPFGFGNRGMSPLAGIKGIAMTWVNLAREMAQANPEVRQAIEAKYGSQEIWEKTLDRAFAEQLGLIRNEMDRQFVNSHWNYTDEEAGGSQLARWLTRRVYRANLMAASETAKVEASVNIARMALRDNIRFLFNEHPVQKIMSKVGIDASAPKSSAVVLRECGIPDAKHESFGRWVMALDGLDDKAWYAKVMGNEPEAKLYRRAIQRLSLGMSVKPDPAMRMESADRIEGRLLMSLMNYTYTFFAMVTGRMYRMTKEAFASGDQTKMDRVRYLAPILAGIMTVAAAYGTREIAGALYESEGTRRRDASSTTAKIVDSASFAGMFPPQVEIAMKAIQRRQLSGGPAVEIPIKTLAAAGNFAAEPSERGAQGVAKQGYKVVGQTALVAGASAVHPFWGFMANQLAMQEGTQDFFIEGVTGQKVEHPKPKKK